MAWAVTRSPVLLKPRGEISGSPHLPFLPHSADGTVPRAVFILILEPTFRGSRRLLQKIATATFGLLSATTQAAVNRVGCCAIEMAAFRNSRVRMAFPRAGFMLSLSIVPAGCGWVRQTGAWAA